MVRLYRISVPTIPPNNTIQMNVLLQLLIIFKILITDYGAVQQGNTSNYNSIKTLEHNSDPIFDPFEAIGMVCLIFR